MYSDLEKILSRPSHFADDFEGDDSLLEVLN